MLQNGGFESNVFPANVCPNSLTQCNIEFDSNYPSGTGVVTGWSSTGYAIYFLSGKQTTQSAQGRWFSSGKEMLDTASTTLSPQGGNFVALDADPTIASTLSQTISGFTVGKQYTLSFYWAASELQSRSGATNEQVNVKFAGATTDANFTTTSVNIPSQGFHAWQQQNVTFLASSVVETLTFLAKSTSTCLPPMVLLDGITLAQTTPEPAAFALGGAGLLLVLLSRFRRRRNREARCSARS